MRLSPLKFPVTLLWGWAWIFSGTEHLQNGVVCGVLVQVLTNGHKWQVTGGMFLQCTEMPHGKLKNILLHTLPPLLQVAATHGNMLSFRVDVRTLCHKFQHLVDTSLIHF